MTDASEEQKKPTRIDKAGAIVDKVGDLPAIPSVIVNSLSILNDPMGTLKKAQEQISLDQALTAFFLKVANSAMYSTRQEIKTLSMALNILGANAAKTILSTYLAKGLYSLQGNKMIQNLIWKHSIATAVIAKRISEQMKTGNAEEAFISGLLHDIGKAVLLKNKPNEFENIVMAMFNDEKTSIAAEEEEFGFTHVEVGYIMMKKLKFAYSMIENLVFHHDPTEYTGENKIIPIISLANKLTRTLEYSFSKAEEPLIELDMIGINEETCNQIVASAQQEMDDHMALLSAAT